MSIFFDRYGALCKERGESPNSVAKKLGVSSGSITAWKRGTMPRIETVNMLASFFNVSADYLLGNVSDPFFYLDNDRIKAEINSYEDTPQTEKAPTPEDKRPITFDDFTYAFYNESKDLPEEKKKMLLDMARFMKADLDKEKGE